MKKIETLLAAALLLLAGMSAATTPAPVDKGSQDIEVTWTERFHVKTGSLPKGVVLTPDETRAWVTNFGHDRGHNITVFDAADGKVIKQISFPGRAVEIAFSKDGSKAYISNFDTGRLMEMDAQTGKTTRQVKVGTNPKIVTLSPDGKTIYVSNWSSNDVSVVDAESFTETARIRVGTNPRGSDTDPSGKLLFVANFNGGSASVVDTEAMKELKKIPMKRLPRHVTTTPDGQKVLISNMGRGSDAVAMVDIGKQEVEKWIKTGRGPKVICVTPESRIAFTADYFGNSVSIIDLKKGKVIAAIPGLGKAPCGMDLSKDGKILYVTSWYSNDLWAFDLAY